MINLINRADHFINYRFDPISLFNNKIVKVVGICLGFLGACYALSRVYYGFRHKGKAIHEKSLNKTVNSPKKEAPATLQVVKAPLNNRQIFEASQTAQEIFQLIRADVLFSEQLLIDHEVTSLDPITYIALKEVILSDLKLGESELNERTTSYIENYKIKQQSFLTIKNPQSPLIKAQIREERMQAAKRFLFLEIQSIENSLEKQLLTLPHQWPAIKLPGNCKFKNIILKLLEKNYPGWRCKISQDELLITITENIPSKHPRDFLLLSSFREYDKILAMKVREDFERICRLILYSSEPAEEICLWRYDSSSYNKMIKIIEGNLQLKPGDIFFVTRGPSYDSKTFLQLKNPRRKEILAQRLYKDTKAAEHLLASLVLKIERHFKHHHTPYTFSRKNDIDHVSTNSQKIFKTMIASRFPTWKPVFNDLSHVLGKMDLTISI